MKTKFPLVAQARRLPRRALPLFLFFAAAALSADANTYRNFSAATCISIDAIRRFNDPKVLEAEWERIGSQVKIGKVYVVCYGGRVITDEAQLERVKAFFTARGVKVAGMIVLTDAGASFCYTDPKSREYVAEVCALTARHFDEIILDDFFFVNTKTVSDIEAKGSRSWTDFRLRLMDEVSSEVLLKPARQANPKVRIIIKFPNWYEHFQGCGYDLDAEPRLFDGIYTGTETRDAPTTNLHLQQYESYQIFRFFENISPGRNGGGWVDTLGLRYVDRYAEQLWDTMLAKAPEIMLCAWDDLIPPVVPGERPWGNEATSFDLRRLQDSYRAHPTPGVTEPSMARVAGYALDQMDDVVGKLGRPIGIASYKPLQSTGEDYLHNFLGMIGIPIDLHPRFPVDAPLVLLTESAKFDRDIVGKIKAHLVAGNSVVITSGLLQALQGRGIEDIAEVRYTGQKVAVNDYFGASAFGSVGGPRLGNPAVDPAVLIPEIRFLTADVSAVIKSVAQENGFPILLRCPYAAGTLYILTIPENFSDLYRYPPGVLTAIRRYLKGRLFVQLEGPSKIALFVYDNRTFVVESFLDSASEVTLAVDGGGAEIRDLGSGQTLQPESSRAIAGTRRVQEDRKRFRVALPAHSYRAFAAGTQETARVPGGTGAE